MTEKRQAVRAEISILARAYRAATADDPARQLLDRPVAPDFYASDETDPGEIKFLDPLMLTFSDFLIQIDEKLDRILNHLEGADEISGAIPVLGTVDLSGTGICLLLKEPVVVGEELVLALRIPGFPRGQFKCLGRVVRVTDRESSDGLFCEAGISFLNVTEGDQDRLIAFTFSQQRQMLRERKARADNAQESIG